MTLVLRQAGALVVVACAATVLVAQQPPGQQAASAPTGLMVGRSVDGTTGKAIGGVVVTLNSSWALGAPVAPPAAPTNLSRFPLRILTDTSGRFVFHDLPKGTYTVTASKPGYADAAFGRRTPTDNGSQSILLGDAERRGDITVPLWKLATLSGTVVDEAGEPVIGIQVRVLKRATVGGKIKFTQFGNMPSTDDRGAYRASSLTPGEYVVGIVTTQTTVPTSLQEAYAAASKAGDSRDLQRELDRSQGILGNGSPMSSGQRVGSWVLQTPIGFGNRGDVMPPPIEGAKVFAYPTTYYPAVTTLSKAMIVALGSGEERSAIDFQLKPVATSRVSGTLFGPNGPEPHTALDLMPAAADELQRDYDFAAASTMTDAKGAFMFLGVPQGAYTIRALKIPPRPVTQSSFTTVIQTGSSTIFSGGGPTTPPPIPMDPTLWATMAVSVGDSDVSDVSVTLRTGARLTGRLEFDGAAEKPTADRLAQATVQIESADGRTTSSNQFTLGRGVVDATGHFNTYQFPPGRYVVRASGNLPGWTFKGASLNGRDVTDAPLDLGGEDVGDVVLTFTDRPTELSGTARNSKGADATATVVVFPATQTLWTNFGQSPRRFRTARVGTDGVYRLTTIPEGEYFVVALSSTLPANWIDATFLQKLTAVATRVTIASGEMKVQDVLTKEVR